MSGVRHWEQDKESTCYVGNLDERVTDALVWELMLQAGRIVNVHLPKDRVTQGHQGYGFVEFSTEEDADYAAKIMNNVRIWSKPIRVNKASADKTKAVEVGAELFVGNLDSMVDEKVLFETFSRFGNLVAAPKVARDENQLSKGYGFLSFADFGSSDDAIVNMHGQYLMNKEITVQYAYKKDGKGERHGDEAERSLARQAKAHGVEVPIPALPAALVMGNTNAPTGPSAMTNGGGPPPNAPSGPSGNMSAPPSYNHYNPSGPSGYPPAPTFNHQNNTANAGNIHPSRQHMQSPIQPPPLSAGVPSRPPPSMGGYGGPQDMPPGMGAGMPPPGFPPPVPYGALPPPPYGLPPPPGFLPPGMVPPPPISFGGPFPPVMGQMGNGYPPPPRR